MITVAIIEDNRLVREAMTEMLNALDDVRVVLTSTSLDIERVRASQPLVVLLDVGLQDGNFLRLAELMQRDLHDGGAHPLRLRQVGALGFGPRDPG